MSLRLSKCSLGLQPRSPSDSASDKIKALDTNELTPLSTLQMLHS